MKREHVKRQLLIHELSFGVVTSRLKAALRLNNDSELAACLGMSTSNFANRKRADSVPFDLLIPLAISRNVSLDWLFRGLGDVGTDGKGLDEGTVLPLDSHLMHEIAQRLWEAIGEAAGGDRDGPERVDGRRLVAYSVVIYNQVVAEADASKRSMRIIDLARFVSVVNQAGEVAPRGP
jgi:hypothetical protein